MIAAKAILNTVHNSVIFGRRMTILSRKLAQIIPSGGRVLDLGCGDGSIAYHLMQLRPDLQVEGVDVLIRPKTHIPVTQFDGGQLPFADKSFDYVTIVDVLHHTADPMAVLAEAMRVARYGVAIKDHMLEGLVARTTLRLMDWVGNRGHGVALPYNYLTRSQWEAAFARVGAVPVRRSEKLELYPAALSWAFGRQLHFMALLAPAGG
jgi:ubiquinone/menaquinone biosynthesis C-methylase UbiE